MNARENGMINPKDQSMNGTGYSMHTAHKTTERATTRTGQGRRFRLRSLILGLSLAVGLNLMTGYAAAQENEQDTRQIQRSDKNKKKPDSKKSEREKADKAKQSREDDKKQSEHEDKDRNNGGGNNGGGNNGGGNNGGGNNNGGGLPPANVAPTVSLGAPLPGIAIAPATFTLNATAADADGTVSKVDFYANNILIGTATAAPYNFIWNNVPAGIHSLTAIATDNLGAIATSLAVAVTVNINQAPSVSLTSPANNTVVTALGNFTLTANATDPDGTIAKVEFFNGTTIIGTATAAPYSLAWNNIATGNYSITARATDNMGVQTTSAINTLTVIAPPVVTLTAPANNTVATAPGSFTLRAAASSAGSITKVDFYASNTATNTLSNIGSVTTGTGGSYSYTWNNVPAGSYNLIAVATDANGAITTSAAVAVISNQAPTVSLTSPAMNAVSVAPGSFTLTANAADADGTIAKVDYYATDSASNTNTLIGTATTAPYSFAWTNVAAGSYTITAVATDNLGASTTSGAVSVISDAVPTISLSSPIANAVSVAPGSFTLTASAASLTSSIAKVDFYQGTTLIGTATTATGGAGTYNLTWSNVPAGTYSLSAVATDVLGTSATSIAINVTSDAPPTVVLSSPASGAKITSPNSFILMASASSTTSTIAKVEFFNGTTLLGTATAAPYLFTWSNVPVGSYSLTAKATDAFGTATTSSAINVTAIANVPPTVSLTGPVNGATVKVPGSFTLTASATSTTSSIAKVEFYASNGTSNTLVGTATTATGGSYTATWSNVALGTYSITAKAMDTLNATTTSTAINVTVNTGVAQVYYIHADHLDSPRQITDTNGNIVWDWQNSDPFGNNIPNENPNGAGQFTFNLRFPGQYFDLETGLFYNINRHLNPATGRYNESDLIGLDGGINTYTYVENNPLIYIDPFGLDLTPAQQTAVSKAAQDWATANVPYAWGGTTKKGADCSGSVSSIYKQAGIDIGRLTTPGFKTSPLFKPVGSGNSLQIGDVGVYDGHVVIYGGSDTGTTGRDVWSASHTGGPAFGPANSSWYGNPTWYRFK